MDKLLDGRPEPVTESETSLFYFRPFLLSVHNEESPYTLSSPNPVSTVPVSNKFTYIGGLFRLNLWRGRQTVILPTLRQPISSLPTFT